MLPLVDRFDDLNGTASTLVAVEADIFTVSCPQCWQERCGFEMLHLSNLRVDAREVNLF